eukprot:gene11617-12674_t
MEVCKELEAFWAEIKADVKEDTWADCYRVLERSKPFLGLLCERDRTFELTVDQRKELEEFLLQVHAFVLKNVERCGSKDSTSFIMRQEAAVDISYFTKKIMELMKYYNLKLADEKGESDIMNHDSLRCEDLKDQRQTFHFLLLNSMKTAQTEEELMFIWKDVDDYVPIIRKFLALNRHMRLTVSETVELNQDMIMMKKILENGLNLLSSKHKMSSSNASRDMTDEESQLPSVSSFVSVGESSETVDEKETVCSSVFVTPTRKTGDKEVSPLDYSAIFSDLDPWSPNASRDILDLTAEEPSIDLKSLSLDEMEIVSTSSLFSNVEGKTKGLLQKMITKQTLTSEEKRLREKHLSPLELQESDVIVTSIRMKQGSFGEIYLGNLSKLNSKGPKTQRIAVKILRGMDQPGKMQSLRQQLENDILLHHFLFESDDNNSESEIQKQRFLHCFGFMSTVSTFELMIEYAPYGALSSFLFKSELLSKIPFSLMLLWLQQVIEAVAYLHSHQIHHGEITPDNIFVFNGLQIKLNYFGTLKQDIEDSLKGNLIPYLAPEIRSSNKKYQASKEVPCSSDIYSFAVTAVAIISQKVPQTATLQSQLLEALLKMPNSSYSAKKRLYDILLQCLQATHMSKENEEDTPRSRRPSADTLVLYLKNLLMTNADQKEILDSSDDENEEKVEILSKEDIKAIELVENILKIKQMDRLTFANVLPDKVKEGKQKRGEKRSSRPRTLPRFTSPINPMLSVSKEDEKAPSVYSSNDSKILSSVTMTTELQSLSSEDHHETIEILNQEDDSMNAVEDPFATIQTKPSIEEKLGKERKHLSLNPRPSSMTLNYTSFLNDEESKDKSQLANYFRSRMEFTIRNSWLVADILVKNGVPSISVLKRRIIKENDFLLSLGVDFYLSDDIIEHFMQLEEEELDEEEELLEQEEKQFAEGKTDKFLQLGVDEKREDKQDYYDERRLSNRPTSLRFTNNRSCDRFSISRPASLSHMPSPSPFNRSSYRLSSNLFGTLPSEVARIYYEASQCRNEDATEKLLAFARDKQDIISQGFVMRLYAKGQGLIQQDLDKAREYGNFLFPQYLMRVEETGKVQHADDLALVYIRYLLGVCYAEGLGVEKNLTEGFVWYKLSADHGNYAGAQAIVGSCYLSEDRFNTSSFGGTGISQSIRSWTLRYQY